MQYSEPKITWLALAAEPLMASNDPGGNIPGGGWNGEIELPPIPMGY